MYFKILVPFLCFAFCLADENVQEDIIKPTKSTPTGIEVVSTGPCGWDISIELSPQCQHDFNLYTEAICTPHIMPDPEKNQTSIFENFWAYKSKVNIK